MAQEVAIVTDSSACIPGLTVLSYLSLSLPRFWGLTLDRD